MRTIATILGDNGKRIRLGIVGGRLTASDGDEVHPDSRPYPRGRVGLLQAIDDIHAMWGHWPAWDLEWASWLR